MYLPGLRGFLLFRLGLRAVHFGRERVRYHFAHRAFELPLDDSEKM
jgi:hypothetical protein